MSGADDFHALRIVRLVREPGDAMVLTLAVPPALAGAFAFKPGQHVAVRADIDGTRERRTYSIAAGPGEALRIAIKRVDGGRFSTWAHATLVEGATLEVASPSGRFVLQPPTRTPRHLLAFAAGSGITPVIGVVRQALATEPTTRVTLVYGNRSREHIIFGEELEQLKDRHLGRFELIHVLTRNDEVEAPLFQGRITPEKVRAFGERLIDYRGIDRVFLCGPGSMIKDARTTLMDLGVPAERITHEFFAAGGGAARAASPPSAVSTAGPAPAAAGDGPEVIAILDGVRHRLRLAPGQHVLDAALKAGIKAPYACAGGMCSTCRARIVEGSARMAVNYSLEPWEIERGFTLACQAIPTSGRLVIDWDAM
jgi:ring-1,2-phenylacetyl-CoA epoxidase subunit PaaE